MISDKAYIHPDAKREMESLLSHLPTLQVM